MVDVALTRLRRGGATSARARRSYGDNLAGAVHRGEGCEGCQKDERVTLKPMLTETAAVGGEVDGGEDFGGGADRVVAAAALPWLSGRGDARTV